MFHRILPKNNNPRIHNHKSLEISTKHFEEIILYFKRLQYQFISINDIYTILTNSESPGKKIVHFTFDDGYFDNYKYAYPVLKKYNVPVTIYITTSFPDYHTIIWWYILEDYILANNFLKFSFSYNLFASAKSLTKKVEFLTSFGMPKIIII